MVNPGLSGVWLLEGLQETGPEGGYLVDPVSGTVYVARSATSWPEPVGWLADTGVVERTDRDIPAWCKMISAVFNDSSRVRKVFYSVANANQELLGIEDIKLIVADLMHGVMSESDMQYLVAVLCVDPTAHLSVQDLVRAGQSLPKLYKTVASARQGAGESHGPLLSTLHSVSKLFIKSRNAAEELFRAYDMDSDGSLDPQEVLYLYKAILPMMTPVQVKLIVIYMQLGDVRGVGKFQYRELLQMFRAIPVRMPHGVHPGTFNTPSSLEATPGSQRRRHRRSSQTMAPGEADLAAPVSASQSSVFLLTIGEKGPMAVFSSLATILQSQPESFDEMFERFDADKNGTLSTSELQTFMATMLDVSIMPSEAHSVKAILDVNGDGKVSREELKSAITDMRMYQQELLEGMEGGPSIQLLSRVVTWICDHIDLAQDLYNRLIPKKKTRMMACSLGRYLKHIEPDAVDCDIRRAVGALIRRMQGFETLKSGTITFRDLVHGARDVKARLVHRLKSIERREDFGRKSNRAALKQLYSELNRALKNPASLEYRKICSLFIRIAGDNNMAKDVMIPEREVQRFLLELLGPSHELEFKYFKAMMMRRSQGPISRKDLFQSIKEGWVILQQPEVSREVPTIKLMTKMLKSNEEQMFKMFRAADHNRDGCIEPDEIMGLVKAVNPEIKRNEVQQCIAVIQALDADRDGYLSFEEFRDGVLSLKHEDVGEQGRDSDPLHGREKMIELIRAMQIRMKSDKMNFDQLFGRHANERGVLELRNLQNFLRSVLGRVDLATTRYFEAMLDINGDGEISPYEMLEAVTETSEAVSSVASGKRVDSSQHFERDLQRVADSVLSDRVAARTIYDKCDTNTDGNLEPRELRMFIKLINPTLGNAQLRILLAHFQGLDINKDGVISFEELIAGMQALSSNPEEDKTTPYGSSGKRLSSSSAGISVDWASPVSPCVSPTRMLRSSSPAELRDIFETAQAADHPKDGDQIADGPEIAMEVLAGNNGAESDKSGRGAPESANVPNITNLQLEESANIVHRLEDTMAIQDGGTSPTIPVAADLPTWGHVPSPSPLAPVVPRLDLDSPKHTFGEDPSDIRARLQEIEHRGRDLFIDPKTNKLYLWPDGLQSSPDSESSEEGLGTTSMQGTKWAGDQHVMPKEIGKLTKGGELVFTETDNLQTNRLAEMYNSLFLHMREKKLKLQDVFYAFDSRGTGKLDRRDLHKLLQHLLGHLKPGELDYFHSRFRNGDAEEIDFLGMKVALREVALVADALYIDHKLILQAESLHVLNQISHEILHNEERAKILFRTFSRRPTLGVVVKKGCMHPLQVPALVKALLPGLSDRQLRFGASHLLSMDRDCDGVIGFGEFLRVLQTCQKSSQWQLPSGTLQPGSYDIAAQESGNIEDVGKLAHLRLEEFAHNGLSLLVEPFSRILYQLPRNIIEFTEDSWPEEVGYLTSRKEVRFTVPVHIGYTRLVELHQELSRFMQDEDLELPQLFQLYRGKGEDGLPFPELCQFLAAFLRDAASDAELIYLHAMLDLNGDGIVSCTELSFVLDEVSDMVDIIFESEEDHGRLALVSIIQSMSHHQEKAKRIFMDMDSHWKGSIPTEMIAPYLRLFSPATTEQDLRFVIAHFARLDQELGSHVTFKELILGLNAAVARRGGNRMTTEMSCTSFTALRKLPVEPWLLQTFAADGLRRHMMLDPSTLRLYAFRHLNDSPTLVWAWEIGFLSEGGVAYLPSGTDDCSSVVAFRLHQVCSALLQDLQDRNGRAIGAFEFYASTNAYGTLHIADLASFLEEAIEDPSAGVNIHLQAILGARECYSIDLQCMQEALSRICTMCQAHTADSNELSVQESSVVDQLAYDLKGHQDHAISLFRKHDEDRSGSILLPDAIAVIRELVTGFLPSDLEVAAMLLSLTDTELRGTIELARFLLIFRIGQREVLPEVMAGNVEQGAALENDSDGEINLAQALKDPETDAQAEQLQDLEADDTVVRAASPSDRETPPDDATGG